MSSRAQLKQILSFIDLTSLEATDHEAGLQHLIRKANLGFDGTFPAAICIYPNLATHVAKTLTAPVKIAVVAGAFPSGQTLTETKIHEVSLVAGLPIDEIDIVINRGAMLSGNEQLVALEIQKMRAAAPHKLLKVILETGELKTPERIRRAAEIAISAGADFIKTSTGKSTQGATLEAAQIMCEVIREHAFKTGKKIGLKPSGGIREIRDALSYMELVQKTLGTTWLTPELFRIGASSLFDSVITALQDENNA